MIAAQGEPGAGRGPIRAARAGYPVVLEICAALLAGGQIAMSWLAVPRLPSTVVPLGPATMLFALPGARADAELWSWAVVVVWLVALGAAMLWYRVGGTTPIPILSTSLLAALAVMRAGAIGMNFDPSLEPRSILLRTVVAGTLTVMLGAALEQARTRPRLRRALAGRAAYDERAPRSPYATILALLVVPLLVLPTRLRVTDEKLLVITRVGYYLVPLAAIASARRASPAEALFGGGLNLSTSPRSSVRLSVRGSLLSLTLSVRDPDRFLDCVAHRTAPTR